MWKPMASKHRHKTTTKTDAYNLLKQHHEYIFRSLSLRFANAQSMNGCMKMKWLTQTCTRRCLQLLIVCAVCLKRCIMSISSKKCNRYSQKRIFSHHVYLLSPFYFGVFVGIIFFRPVRSIRKEFQLLVLWTNEFLTLWNAYSTARVFSQINSVLISKSNKRNTKKRRNKKQNKNSFKLSINEKKTTNHWNRIYLNVTEVIQVYLNDEMVTY